MRHGVKLVASGVVIAAALLLASPVLGQGYPATPGRPQAGASPPMPQIQVMPRTDTATASFGVPPPVTPIVNPPDPLNAGTLAESARTTALASSTYGAP